MLLYHSCQIPQKPSTTREEELSYKLRKDQREWLKQWHQWLAYVVPLRLCWKVALAPHAWMWGVEAGWPQSHVQGSQLEHSNNKWMVVRYKVAVGQCFHLLLLVWPLALLFKLCLLMPNLSKLDHLPHLLADYVCLSLSPPSPSPLIIQFILKKLRFFVSDLIRMLWKYNCLVIRNCHLDRKFVDFYNNYVLTYLRRFLISWESNNKNLYRT